MNKIFLILAIFSFVNCQTYKTISNTNTKTIQVAYAVEGDNIKFKITGTHTGLIILFNKILKISFYNRMAWNRYL
jgi:hypothetical protein